MIEIPYVLSRHPLNINPEQFLQTKEMESGANCQLYAIGVLTAMGAKIPPYRSSEIFEDPNNCLIDIDPYKDLPKSGDIIGFWPDKGPMTPKRIHLGIIKFQHGKYEVLHASRREGKVTSTPLSEMTRRYSSIACIKRPKEIDTERINYLALESLGFIDKHHQ